MDAMYAVAHLQDGMHFSVETGSGSTIQVDMLDDVDVAMTSAGCSPMELLLVALAGCTGISVLSILRKRQQNLTGYELHVSGVRASQHPKVFTSITVEHRFTGRELDAKWVERAIALSEERYCGVEAMLSKTAKISHSYVLHDEQAT